MKRRLLKKGGLAVLLVVLLFGGILASVLLLQGRDQNGTVSLGSDPGYPAESPPIDGQKAAAASAQAKGLKSTYHTDVKGMWISYLDLASVLRGKSEQEFTQNITAVFDNCKSMGLNTVIVQVRPFGDALYPSALFPWSHTVTGVQGKDPGYDPLKIMVALAHERQLSFHAWINPLRVKSADAKMKLSENNQAAKWFAEETKKNDWVVETADGLFLNPAIPEARQLVIDGAVEIVKNYDVDAIHLDDYFYPTTDESFDYEQNASNPPKAYNRYLSEGGKLSHADFRRENINQLVSGLYKAVKEADSSVAVGISPQGNNDNNYNTQYADVTKWMQSDGYLDYVCPQIYWEFSNAQAPFSDKLAQWSALATNEDVALYIGLAPYKIGTEGEWAETDDLMKRQIETIANNKRSAGFMLFRYDSLFHPSDSISQQVDAEKQNIEAFLKTDGN